MDEFTLELLLFVKKCFLLNKISRKCNFALVYLTIISTKRVTVLHEWLHVFARTCNSIALPSLTETKLDVLILLSLLTFKSKDKIDIGLFFIVTCFC